MLKLARKPHQTPDDYISFLLKLCRLPTPGLVASEPQTQRPDAGSMAATGAVKFSDGPGNIDRRDMLAVKTLHPVDDNAAAGRRSGRADEARSGLIAYGDPHGDFRPLLQACREARPEAVVLLGDCNLDRPLRQELQPLFEDGVQICWIPGNHDIDQAVYFVPSLGRLPRRQPARPCRKPGGSAGGGSWGNLQGRGLAAPAWRRNTAASHPERLCPPASPSAAMARRAPPKPQGCCVPTGRGRHECI